MCFDPFSSNYTFHNFIWIWLIIDYSLIQKIGNCWADIDTLIETHFSNIDPSPNQNVTYINDVKYQSTPTLKVAFWCGEGMTGPYKEKNLPLKLVLKYTESSLFLGLLWLSRNANYESWSANTLCDILQEIIAFDTMLTIKCSAYLLTIVQGGRKSFADL